MKPKTGETIYKRAILWIVIAIVVKISGNYIANGMIASGDDVSIQNEANRLATTSNIIASLMAFIGLVILFIAGYNKRKNR